jgi:hypothetical protein
LKTSAICKGIPPSSISKKENFHQDLKMREEEEEEEEDFNLIEATDTADFLFDFLLAPYVLYESIFEKRSLVPSYIAPN